MIPQNNEENIYTGAPQPCRQMILSQTLGNALEFSHLDSFSVKLRREATEAFL